MSLAGEVEAVGDVEEVAVITGVWEVAVFGVEAVEVNESCVLDSSPEFRIASRPLDVADEDNGITGMNGDGEVPYSTSAQAFHFFIRYHK